VISPPRSIQEIAALLRSGAATAVELAEATLERIEAFEPALNAFLTVTRTLALEQAAAVDDLLAAGVDLGPLMGVPIAVKDTFATRGVPTTGGSSTLARYVPRTDADVVVRLRAAGVVLVGKTNMNEFGWGLDPRLGRVNNPLDPSRTAGGSSGGSAAAVGSSNIVAAVGTDSGGSIRIPAAFCAVVGFKPSHGRVPDSGMLPGCWSLTDAGPIAHSAADAAAVFGCLARAPEEKQSCVCDPPTLGVLEDWIQECRPEIASALDCALTRLAQEGWRLIPVRLDLSGTHAAWMLTFLTETATALAPFLGERLADTSAEVRWAVNTGLTVPAHAYLRAGHFREQLRARVDKALGDVDALVAPTASAPPTADEPPPRDEAYYADMRFTVPFNLTGHPAVSLPARAAVEPAGLQLIGRLGDDERLLALAARLEDTLERRVVGAA
jgi:aspartyl-tRNA(Asn)/glutamyl-tRNA(Gln) amidotransferase subunit A